MFTLGVTGEKARYRKPTRPSGGVGIPGSSLILEAFASRVAGMASLLRRDSGLRTRCRRTSEGTRRFGNVREALTFGWMCAGCVEKDVRRLVAVVKLCSGAEEQGRRAFDSRVDVAR